MRCDSCGASLLRPGPCCGAVARPAAAPYYVASGSGGGQTGVDFSIVMPTKNNLHLTRVAVESLRRAAGHSVEFVFVDCCSTDGTLNYYQDLAQQERVTLLVTHPEEPFVYSRNCNRGAEAARGRQWCRISAYAGSPPSKLTAAPRAA